MNITLEFGGGAELLVSKQKQHKVTLPQDKEWRIQELLYWIRDNILAERPELFLKENTVRPGILVLVNDADWELLGQLEYKLVMAKGLESGFCHSKSVYTAIENLLDCL